MTISGSDFLKRVTYRSEAKALARALGLRKTFRNWYYGCARPSNGIVEHRIRGLTARFRVRTPGELRNLDPAGGAQQEQKILELLMASVHEKDVVFDIGANVGFYTVFLALAVGAQGQVIAFEPNTESYQHLQVNLALNAVTNVRVFRTALGERNGQGRLYQGQENADSSLIGPPLGKDVGHQLVDIVAGDSFREAERLPIPRVVKIDVEGYEYQVLQGLQSTLSRPPCELLCCEVHPRFLPKGVTPEGILSFVRLLGFRSIGTYSRWDTSHLLARRGESTIH
jgi:FkbM family methyltransferase